MPYGFSGQAKQGNTFTHNNIISDMSGWMDLTVSNIDKKMTITVELINIATRQVVMADTFNATGSKQYMIDEGAYEMQVMVDEANGNAKYEIRLLMPENIYVSFDDEEVPLAGPDLLKDIISKGSTPLEICMRFKCQPEVLNEYYLDFIAAGWTKEDLGWFGLAEIFDNEAPLADSPQTGDAGPVNMILLFVVSLLGIGILLRLRKCLVRGR
jgi:LPXTG-motif cell wall-anchored protein